MYRNPNKQKIFKRGKSTFVSDVFFSVLMILPNKQTKQTLDNGYKFCFVLNRPKKTDQISKFYCYPIRLGQRRFDQRFVSSSTSSLLWKQQKKTSNNNPM